MGFTSPIRAICVVAGLVALAACAGGSAVAPSHAGRDSDRAVSLGITSAGPTTDHLRQHFVSHDSCPATGSLKYVSDSNDNEINIYVGKFAGQAPCGQIASSTLNVPVGLYVQDATHDLYVANNFGHNISVFHRGQTSPYNTYTDPTGQFVYDVTTTPDGTVIASNVFQYGGNERGSISTWVGGPNGGTFVGNFPIKNAAAATFVTSRKNGKVYFDDTDDTLGLGVVWSVMCPAGACGAQTQVAGLTLKYPGGMAIDATGDLLVNDQFADTADTFELPNPKASTFPLVGYPNGMATDKNNHHWFVSDGANNIAYEYSYPGGKLVGSVPGNAGGSTIGIAVDP
jgi:hypothetical protein